MTRPMAKRAMAEAVRAVNDVIDVKPLQPLTLKGMTRFGEFVAKWQAEVLALSKTSSRLSAESHLRTSLLPQFGGVAIGDIGSEAVQSFVNDLGKRLAPNSVTAIYNTLRSILSVARDWGYTDATLRIKLPKLGHRPKRKIFSIVEIHSLLTEAEGDDRALLWLLFETGIRCGEALGLRAADLDMTAGTISVERAIYKGVEASPKTNSSVRVIDVSPDLCSLLAPLMSREVLFGIHAGTAARLSGWFKRGCQRAGVGNGRSLHSVRHTNASLMDSLLVPSSTKRERLGHAAQSMTDHYSHAIDGKPAAKKIGALLGNFLPTTFPLMFPSPTAEENVSATVLQ